MEGGFQDLENEWRSTPDVMNLKQSINFECSNSIPINFTESWSYFMTNDMQNLMSRSEHIKPQASRKLGGRFRGLVGNPHLNPSLVFEQELIFAIAACPMNNDVSVHRRILQSIYVFMTKNPTCPRYGTHWEEIGFQGQDPASDLRGVGMFGALQMLYLSSAQETKETLAPEIFKLSRHPIHEFPLAVLSLNVTKMALDAFRDGILNRMCNKANSAIFIVNQFYLAILYRVFIKWSNKGVTIHESCFLLKAWRFMLIVVLFGNSIAVEKWCRAHPKKTVRRLHKYLDTHSAASSYKRQKGMELRSKSHPALHSSWLDLTKPSFEVFI
ncbi:ELMO domain-containing protein 3 [Orchesella cincta]|uniref:ELMO domain-containing protein 3 n=1 Tax=Orchesella cincta TaxID=48709 RepID=A0A1D2MQY1_ORCCI|nr:ELMO domain-containing protein 3 [Orchesella cincta]